MGGRQAEFETAAADLAGCRGSLATAFQAGANSDAQLKACLADKSAHTREFVACQNQVIDLKTAAETASAAAGSCEAALADCDTRLADAISHPKLTTGAQTG